MNKKGSFGFPFSVTQGGRINATGGDVALRGKIVQVLFTSRGERVNLPEFGCGLLDLVFDINDPILAALVEFTITQSLIRWLSQDIKVEAVNVEVVNENCLVEVVYIRRQDLMAQAVRINFK